MAIRRRNVQLCGMSPGMAYGELGPTHHSIEDLAWTRVIPNLAVVVPADPIETAAAMRYSLQHDGRCFCASAECRCGRYMATITFRFGKADVTPRRQRRDADCHGVLVARALEAAQALGERGVSARVLNMGTVKPLDREAILDAARSTRGIVTAEEGLAAGGLGGAVAEMLATEHPMRMRILGLPDVFAPTGSAEFLLEHFGLTAKGIYNAAIELMGTTE